MVIRAALLDLDDTLTTEDMLDVVCDIAGNRYRSVELNEAFRKGSMTGTDSLIARINLLNGIPVQAIKDKLQENPYLRQGAGELVDYLKSEGIVTAIQSRNLMPVLEYYQELLGVDYVLGTMPVISDGRIQNISRMNLPGLKSEVCREFLDRQGISPQDTLAIGDSMGDRKIFELVGASIAVNPRGEIQKYATEVIYDDLRNAISIIRGWMDNWRYD